METKEHDPSKTKDGTERPADDLLTGRERDVIERAAAGAVDKEISRDLGLQPSTLNGYWKHIRLKLGVSTRTEAVARYLQASTTKAMDERADLKAQVMELEAAVSELRNREHEIRSFLECVPEGVIALDRDGKIYYCNPRFAALMCLSMDEVLGRTIQSLLDPAAAAVIRKKLGLRSRGVTSNYDLDVMVRSGKQLCLRFSGSPLKENGRVKGVVTVVADVTDRKRLEKALRVALDESRRRGEALEAVFDVSPVGVVEFDAQGSPVRVNDRMLEMLGLPEGRLPTKEEWLAVPCYRQYPARKLPPRMRLSCRLLGGEDRIYEDRMVVDAGEMGVREILSSGVALKNQAGEPYGAIQVTVDSPPEVWQS